MSAIGLYLHIPFCRSLCGYCAFAREPTSEPLVRRYIAALIREIQSAAEPETPVDTIYLGGGTPSLVGPDVVARLLCTCREAFSVDPHAEITLEANPETVDGDSLAGFLRAGVNRLSLGVQSFQPHELMAIDRRHTVRQAVAATHAAREAGFESVNLDLMLGLPGQTQASWMASIDTLVDLEPEHASLYMLELHEGTPLAVAADSAAGCWLPDEDAVADMYLAALERLDEYGYVHYEISNVARPGRACRHNLKYWSGGEWVGFGCAAHSTRHDVRWENARAAADYVDRIEAGVTPAVLHRRLSRQERLEEAWFLGLRLAGGLSLSALERSFGMDMWGRYGSRLARYLEAGVVVREGDRVRLTRHGMLVANEILSAFVETGCLLK